LIDFIEDIVRIKLERMGVARSVERREFGAHKVYYIERGWRKGVREHYGGGTSKSQNKENHTVGGWDEQSA